MIFNNNNSKSSFRPSLLTPENFDKFAQKYSSPTPQYGTDVPYITQDRKKIYFSNVTMSKTTANEFDYFLAQTMPFHKTDRTVDFPISHLAYIMDSNGKPHAWTTDTRVLMNFILVGNAIGSIPLQKQGDKLIFSRYPGIKPIIHTERTHTDD